MLNIPLLHARDLPYRTLEKLGQINIKLVMAD
jgi:hypothetical protein